MHNEPIGRAAIEAAAAAIANARIMRRGSPAISNVLDMLPEKLRAEVMEDATAALQASPLRKAFRAIRMMCNALEDGDIPDDVDEIREWLDEQMKE